MKRTATKIPSNIELIPAETTNERFTNEDINDDEDVVMTVRDGDAVSSEDLDALRTMVYDMLRNPDLLYMSPLYSGAVLSSSSSSSVGPNGDAATPAAVSRSSSTPSSRTMEDVIPPSPIIDESSPSMMLSYYICRECYTPPSPPSRIREYPSVSSSVALNAPRLPFY